MEKRNSTSLFEKMKQNKNWIIGLILLVLTSCGGMTGNVVLEVPSFEVNQGDQVRLDITVTDVTNLMGVQLAIKYNPDVLAFHGIIEGNFLNEKRTSATYFPTPDTSTGNLIDKVILLRLGNGGVDGTGVLASAYFDVIESGNSELKIQEILLSDEDSNPIDSLHVNAQVTVKPNSFLNPGDLNGDEKVDLLDVVIILTEFGKTGYYDPKADVTKDGKIDVHDITKITKWWGKRYGIDNSPPTILNSKPSGNLNSITSLKLGVVTDEIATCGYSEVPDTEFVNMNQFAKTGSTVTHVSKLNVESREYTYFVRCTDESENVHTSDHVINFVVT